MTNKITKRIISAIVAITTVATFSVASMAEEADPRAEVAKAAYERIVQEKGLNPANPYHEEVWLTAMQEAGYVGQYTDIIGSYLNLSSDRFGIVGVVETYLPDLKTIVAYTAAGVWESYLSNMSDTNVNFILELDSANRAVLPISEKGLPYLELYTYTVFLKDYMAETTITDVLSIIEKAEGMVTDGKTNKEVVEFLLQEASARVTV